MTESQQQSIFYVVTVKQYVQDALAEKFWTFRLCFVKGNDWSSTALVINLCDEKSKCNTMSSL